MSIHSNNLSSFISYINETNLEFKLDLNVFNYVNSSLIWYKNGIIFYSLNVNTKTVLVWKMLPLNLPLDIFLDQMNQWKSIYKDDLIQYAESKWKEKIIKGCFI